MVVDRLFGRCCQKWEKRMQEEYTCCLSEHKDAGRVREEGAKSASSVSLTAEGEGQDPTRTSGKQMEYLRDLFC